MFKDSPNKIKLITRNPNNSSLSKYKYRDLRQILNDS